MTVLLQEHNVCLMKKEPNYIFLQIPIFISGSGTIFLRLKDRLFSFQNNPKHLDPSYKMDLDHWDCLRRVKLVSRQNFIGLT